MKPPPSSRRNGTSRSRIVTSNSPLMSRGMRSSPSSTEDFSTKRWSANTPENRCAYNFETTAIYLSRNTRTDTARAAPQGLIIRTRLTACRNLWTAGSASDGEKGRRWHPSPRRNRSRQEACPVQCHEWLSQQTAKNQQRFRQCHGS